MVVGAEHVDAQIESALPLIEVVGEIPGDVRGLTIALDDHPILVVTEFRCAQPGRAVLLVNGAVLAKFGDRLIDPSRSVHRIFMGIDVEVGSEVMQGTLDVVEHQLHADRPEGLTHLVIGKTQRVRGLGGDLSSDVTDVCTGVAVLRVGSPLTDATKEFTNRSICAP